MGNLKTEYKCKDFRIRSELISGNTYVHCDFYATGAGVTKAMYDCRLAVSALHQDHGSNVYAVRVDDKHEKFLKFMGFQFYSKVWAIDDGGNDCFRDIWVRLKND